jgi:excisionase family DNA binding protein
MNKPILDVTREAFSISEVCAATALGRTTIYEAITAGSLKVRKLGKRTLVLPSELRDFLRSLPGAD